MLNLRLFGQVIHEWSYNWIPGPGYYQVGAFIRKSCIAVSLGANPYSHASWDKQERIPKFPLTTARDSSPTPVSLYHASATLSGNSLVTVSITFGPFQPTSSYWHQDLLTRASPNFKIFVLHGRRIVSFCLFASLRSYVSSSIPRRPLVNRFRIRRHQARLFPGVLPGVCVRLLSHFCTDFAQLTSIV